MFLVCDSDTIELDEVQLPLALKTGKVIAIDVAIPSSPQQSKIIQDCLQPEKKDNHWESQARSFGRFQKQKSQSRKRHPGLGRQCPRCEKELRDATSLKRHLLSDTACPQGPVDKAHVESLLAESMR